MGSFRRLVAVALGAVAGLALTAGIALADNGPHAAGQNANALLGSCAACHRAHSGQAPNLLAGPLPALCYSCHGSGTAGATTDVKDGIRSGTARGLKGGGFAYAIMDTTWTGSATSRATTSAHLVDGTTSATMWGNGAIGSGPGAPNVKLSCVSCHDPHGGAGTGGGPTYRILRAVPTGSGAATGIDVTDEAVKTYTVASLQNRYFGELYGGGNYLEEYKLVQWCAQCHTRYDAVESGTGHIDSGDPIFKYRHMTRYPMGDINCGLCHPGPNGINAADPFNVGAAIAHEGVCQNCHVAHGTAAVMGSLTGTVAWPDGQTSPSGDARSSLLRLDGRGVCQGCHAR